MKQIFINIPSLLITIYNYAKANEFYATIDSEILRNCVGIDSVDRRSFDWLQTISEHFATVTMVNV